ncbi:MAG: 3-dehydroquinate synthase [Ruminococcus sp.]|nr:3-dehydroquinate synthase [Ruminococcus sp.]
MKSFNVTLKKVVDNSYNIDIGYNPGDQLVKDLKNGLCKGYKKVAVISDSTVASLYAESIVERLEQSGFSPKLFVFPEGEKSKVRKTKEMLEDAMLEAGFRRDCCVVAVGGGVVTDLAGFLAGTFGRGVPFVNYATTLLAAADASVGGKTAVDTPVATNLIGIFNQPKKVYIDLAAWKTLPKRQISSGLAETIKHAMMADIEFFEYLEQNVQRVFEFDEQVCEHIAEKNCEIKYSVVMKDELESSLREILNLGHTVGRAIETVSDYRLLHGEAVAIGLLAECELSCSLGFMTSDEVARVKALLNNAQLSTDIPDYIDRNALVDKLYTDKKVRDGCLRFVLQDGIGRVKQFENSWALKVPRESIEKIILNMK